MKNAMISLVLAATLALSSMTAFAAESEELQMPELGIQEEETTVEALPEEDAERRDAAQGTQEDLVRIYEAEKAAFMEGSGLCSYGQAIEEEWNRQRHYTEFYMGADRDLIRFSPEVTEWTETKADGARLISIKELVRAEYEEQESSLNGSTTYGFSFTLRVDADNRVTELLDTEANYEALENEGVFFTADGVEYAETDAPEAEEEILVGAPEAEQIEFTYNVKKAIEYADRWAMSQNPAYHYYKNEGGDCANFVSQCLNAGGIPINRYWDPKAKWVEDEEDNAFTNWVGNNELRQYLVRHGLGVYVKNPSASQLKKGDLVFYNWHGKQTYTNHVAIVVDIDENGQPLVDGHTDAVMHANWKLGGKGTYYSAVLMNPSSKKQSFDKNKYEELYRLYNPNSGEHFYTANALERDHLVRVGWSNEGTGWIAPLKSKTPIYRVYNPNAGDHHYTTNKLERDHLVAVGWRDEGILCYSDDAKTTPIYREYNPNAKAGAHNFTRQIAEHKNLVRLGWKDESIAWYAA